MAVAGALLIATTCSAQQLTIAAAADLQAVMPEIAAQFQKQTNIPVKLLFGSSGNFYTQIQNGAPFDLFFSADIAYPQKLDASGLTEPGSLYEYGAGKIVLLALKSSNLNLNKGLGVLLDDGVGKIAIANPEHAPYGRAAVAALKHENLYDKVSGRLVLGENISQTASFVVSGAADVGIVALSLVMTPAMQEKGKYAEIPTSDYPPIKQAAVILKSSSAKENALRFMQFVKTEPIVQLLEKYGFSVQIPIKPAPQPTESRVRIATFARLSLSQIVPITSLWPPLSRLAPLGNSRCSQKR